jgi:type I restriction enzyme R subunit
VETQIEAAKAVARTLSGAANGGNRLSALDKKTLSEGDICDLFISPALKSAGWDQITQIRREVTLAPGPVIVRGNVASRNKKKRKFVDYVLYQEPGVPIAVVEAKDNNHTVSRGLHRRNAPTRHGDRGRKG